MTDGVRKPEGLQRNTAEESASLDVAPGEGPTSTEEAQGWEALVEWTGSLSPDSIEELRDVRPLETVYPLLHALVGRSLRDFLVRAAALKSIVAAGRAALSARDLDEALYWLDDRAREATLRALRASGWLAYEASVGTVLTDAGRWAYDVVSFLHKRLAESELLPTVAGVEYALRIGVDPVWHLDSLRSRLVALREEIEAARASHSEVVLRRAATKLDDALRLSADIRAVLDQVPLDHRAARRIAREIHELLSRLHGGSSELHAALTQVGRQYLRLAAGLTVEQIVRALMRKSREELARAGRESLLPVLASPPLLTTDVVGSAAEEQVLRERHAPKPMAWEEPPEAPRSMDASVAPAEVLALLGDLAAIARSAEPAPLEAVVPRGDHGESFLRASLLPLAGDRRSGEGVAGQLGALPLEVEPAGDGSPAPLEGGPLSALTPGVVRARHGADGSG